MKSDLRALFPQVGDSDLILTQSTINSLELSPCRVLTIPDGVTVPASEAMVYGTVQHAMIEKFLKEEFTALQLVNLNTVDDIFSEILETQDVEPFDFGIEWYAELADLFNSWHKTFYTTVGKHWSTELVEQSLISPLYHFKDGRWAYLATRGVDWLVRANGDLLGIDFKTTSRGYWGSKGTAQNQDDAYAYLLSRNGYELVTDWRFIVGNRSKMEWVVHPTRVTEQSMMSFVARAIEWAKFLALDDPPKLCTPVDSGTQRGWWSRRAYNHGYCENCKWLADEHDKDWS